MSATTSVVLAVGAAAALSPRAGASHSWPEARDVDRLVHGHGGDGRPPGHGLENTPTQAWNQINSEAHGMDAYPRTIVDIPHSTDIRWRNP